MKNLFVTLSFVLATAAAPVLANETDVDPRTEAVFAKQFAGAENVKWTRIDQDYKKVAFTLGGIRAEAYFSSNGELLGTIRNIFYNQLPMVVMQSVGSRFTEAVVIEVKEITNPEGTSYRVVLEQKDRKYSIKLNSSGDITETEKVKKK